MDGATKSVLEAWFDAYQGIVREFKILEKNTYNMDESGFSIRTIESTRIIVDSALRTKHQKHILAGKNYPSTQPTAQRRILLCNIKTSTRDISTNMSPMEAALAAIESLKPGEKLVYTEIARKHGVEPTTLARRYKGASTSRLPLAKIDALSTHNKNKSFYAI
ncbi:hypothetical protein GQ44DRAFT_772726 [Phaeosphaeriaceae sp. PMI808]|nr:hypothetical protein GQ44DRAFT_772726 [Phaeosphaeriaceae sp. PMI808]